VIGLSSLNGEHLHFTRRVLGAMQDRQMTDVLLVVGGIVPAEDMAELHDMGVAGVFPAGSAMRDIVGFITGHVRAAGAGRG